MARNYEGLAVKAYRYRVYLEKLEKEKEEKEQRDKEFIKLTDELSS